MTAATRTRRRAKVRTLAEEGLSNRAIAKRVGVGESTVRRWRAADCAAAAPEGAPDTAPPPADGPATLAPPDDADFRDDLAVLAQAGLEPGTAVTLAVQLLADAYRSAWDYGDVPRGARPRVHVITNGASAPT